MDITSFINSSDIRDYHHEIGYQYNALEAAWLVYHCGHVTLAEKHAAWKWIIDTLPDTSLHDYSDCDYLSGKTVHQILAEYMDMQNFFLDEFKSVCIDGHFAYTRPSKWVEGVFTSFDNEGAFSSYDKCVECALKQVDFTKTGYIVIRRKALLDYGEVFINSEGSILDVDPDCSEEEKFNEYRYFFDRCCFDLPVPFKRGDIVCIDDELQEYRKPIVLTDICVEDMCIAGYIAVDAWQHGLYRNTFGNYMDVEYYRDELKGIDRILKPLSDWLKGECGDDISQVLSEYYRIMKEEEQKKKGS